MAFTYEYPRPQVTVDCVVFGIGPSSAQEHEADAAKLVCKVLLIERKGEPHKGRWALPGGFVEVKDGGDQGETLDRAAHRELKEETGVEVDYLEQLYTFGAPGRDPRGRTISIAYYALVRSTDHVELTTPRLRRGRAVHATAADDAAAVRWLPLRDAARFSFAFDHGEIVRMATERLQAKVRYAPVGFNLLPPRFTLSELQHLYEAILLRDLDKRNFRKRILAMDILAEAGRQENVPHRAATLYRFDKRAYDRAVKQGLYFEV